MSVRLIDASAVTLRPDRGRAGGIRGYELVVREAGQETVRQLSVADAESMLWLQLRRPTRVASACVAPEHPSSVSLARQRFDLWRYRDAWYAAPADATSTAMLGAIAAITPLPPRTVRPSREAPRAKPGGAELMHEGEQPEAAVAWEQPPRPCPPRALRDVGSGCFVRGEVFEVRADDGVVAAWMEPAVRGILLRTGDGGKWTISRVGPGWSFFAASISAEERDATFEASWLRSGGRLNLRPSGRMLRLRFLWTKWQLVETRRTVLATFSRPRRNGPLQFDLSAAFAQSADMELALPFALWMATAFEANTDFPSK